MTTAVAPIVGPQAQNSRLTIQKVTLKKQLLYAEFSEQVSSEEKPRSFTMQGTELAHPDLETAFAALVPHFCLLTEQLKETPDYWLNDETVLPHTPFDGYAVTGLILSSKASGGVTLMGFRTLASGKVLNLTGQYVSFAEQAEEFTEADGWHYPHTEALQGLVQDAIGEVDAALRGKCSEAGRQLEMFQEKEVELGEIVARQPVKKRKARRIATKAEEAAE